MANVEALAQNEGGITECVGCVVTSNNLCKTFGDWGACVGESDGTVSPILSEITFHVFTNIIDVIVLEITISPEMEKEKNSHYL